MSEDALHGSPPFAPRASAGCLVQHYGHRFISIPMVLFITDTKMPINTTGESLWLLYESYVLFVFSQARTA